jgi:hypothetical protein
MFPGLTTKLSEGVVASGTTITLPRADLIQVTGTTTIVTMTQQFGGGFSGVQFFWASDGSVTFNTGGNILAAFTMAQNQIVVGCFSKKQQKWIIGAIS